ncbi:VOC family protein [Candidatus Giovannonibacteria bacterium]|nr:VOC family protein [Candidatus Giovannonibacteria bacterium]
MQQKITPFLWFDDNAEEAVNFYISIFKNSKKGKVTYYDEEIAKAAKMPVGSALVIPFEIEGQQFLAFNGGPVFKFNESISFVVNCDSQKDIDYFWEKLSAVKEAEQCGWLKDKFGLSWQIVPAILGELMSDPDPEKAKRVSKAMLQMKKIDIDQLKKAAD